MQQQQREFSLHGAVDLGARQAAAKRKQEAAQPPEGGTAHVIEATDENFNAEVVARSASVPVIVDLWADWCQPCKQLGPVLEKLAAEADGAWLLAKVDVDANPGLAQALQAQSIPMVVAVMAGQLVDGFVGALPEPQVREWLSQVLEVAGRLGLPGAAGAPAAPAEAQAGPGAGAGPPAAPADPMTELAVQARQAMEAGDLDAASAALEKILAADPGNPAATAWLAQVELMRRIRSYDIAAVQRDAARLPEDPDAQARAADLDVAANRLDAAFDRMLGVIQRTSGEQRDAARAHLVGLFDLLPPKDSRVAKARGRLSSLLF